MYLLMESSEKVTCKLIHLRTTPCLIRQLHQLPLQNRPSRTEVGGGGLG